MVKVFETSETVSHVKMNIFQMKIFDKIILLLFIIYSFFKFMANIKGFLLKYCVLFFEENIKCDISPRQVLRRNMTFDIF